LSLEERQAKKVALAMSLRASNWRAKPPQQCHPWNLLASYTKVITVIYQSHHRYESYDLNAIEALSLLIVKTY
jgi:hypothetical protein